MKIKYFFISLLLLKPAISYCYQNHNQHLDLLKIAKKIRQNNAKINEDCKDYCLKYKGFETNPKIMQNKSLLRLDTTILNNESAFKQHDAKHLYQNTLAPYFARKAVTK